MDVVILCGGEGTRLSEETTKKPKPMVNIGGMPILWHIMKIYSYYGFKRFILCLGYKGEVIKEYFYNYRNINSDIILRLDPQKNIDYINKGDEKDWEIVLIDTGQKTLKGGRIKRVEQYIQSKSFHLTYGDGVGDINIDKLVKFHNSHNCLGTITAVRPPSRFGELNINNNDLITSLEEKPQMGRRLINGGFFVFNKKILDKLSEDENCDFEFGPLQQLSTEGELKAYKHKSFWHCMDNIRERDYLSNLVKENKASWMIWNNKKTKGK